MENLCSRVSAYLYIGASVQMAFSLGLHRDQLAESASNMEREQNRRIWWTLFILDQELASRGGSPTIIDERFTKVETPMSSEQVCDPPRSFDRCHILIADRSCTQAYILHLVGKQPQCHSAGSSAKSFKPCTRKDLATQFHSPRCRTHSCYCRNGIVKCLPISNTMSQHRRHTNAQSPFCTSTIGAPPSYSPDPSYSTS